MRFVSWDLSLVWYQTHIFGVWRQLQTHQLWCFVVSKEFGLKIQIGKAGVPLEQCILRYMKWEASFDNFLRGGTYVYIYGSHPTMKSKKRQVLYAQTSVPFWVVVNITQWQVNIFWWNFFWLIALVISFMNMCMKFSKTKCEVPFRTSDFCWFLLSLRGKKLRNHEAYHWKALSEYVANCKFVWRSDSVWYL